MAHPVVAIVGRPNVGKSSLFNRILGRRKALVQDTPGVTRDRNYALADTGEREFLLCDTGGFEEHEGVATEVMARLIREQALVAIREADVIVFVMDIREGLTPTDREIAGRLRGVPQPVIWVLNKADHPNTDVLVSDFYALGVDGFLSVSAEHGINMVDLEDAIVEALPEDGDQIGAVEAPWDGVGVRDKPSRRKGREREATGGAQKGGRMHFLGSDMLPATTTRSGPAPQEWDGEAWEPQVEDVEEAAASLEPGIALDDDGVQVLWVGPELDPYDNEPFDAEDIDPDELPDYVPGDADEFVPRIAVLGRPNVGKSTLINRLLGYQRSITSPEAGTTRDSVDVYFERDDQRFVLIDTAGVRKRRNISERLEKLTVGRALRTIEAAHVVLLVVDGTEGVTEQEARLGAMASERGRALTVIVNKWDLKPKGEGARREFMDQLRRRFPHLAWADVLFISALTGRGVHKLWDAVERANSAHRFTLGTGVLNRWARTVWGATPPPMHKHRPVRFYYVTQTGIRPPTFTFFANQPGAVSEQYRRFLVNQLRAAFDLRGSPIRLVLKDRSGS